jgi:predicted dehydrogenase
MVRIGVIGYGYWGPNLVRNFAEAEDTQVIAVADMKSERLQLATRRYPGIEAVSDYRDLLKNPHIDAVAISTPVSTHFSLAMEALQAGKHVLVEKPMTADTEQALRLIDEAARRNLVLMVDHTFVYTGAIRKMRELITAGSIGDIY